MNIVNSLWGQGARRPSSNNSTCFRLSQSINVVNLLIIDEAILENLTIKGILDFATLIEGGILTLMSYSLDASFHSVLSAEGAKTKFRPAHFYFLIFIFLTFFTSDFFNCVSSEFSQKRVQSKYDS